MHYHNSNMGKRSKYKPVGNKRKRISVAKSTNKARRERHKSHDFLKTSLVISRFIIPVDLDYLPSKLLLQRRITIQSKKWVPIIQKGQVYFYRPNGSPTSKAKLKKRKALGTFPSTFDTTMTDMIKETLQYCVTCTNISHIKIKL